MDLMQPALARDLTGSGFMTKRWTSRAGITHGGIPFNCSGLSLILRNRLYLGEIVHWGIQRGILRGELGAKLDMADLLRRDIPLDWQRQRPMFEPELNGR
ncbi:hypothetical protein [Sandarakinorhabdus oryzae]|uniref:hypothetical protein n=1 Tax=Sandarakinorhabdus oryzae TaxID=2675220 RepID=UPI0012E0F724|nr:hypothetical protein [Sandarakinorhabdus oryzae]